MFFLYSTSLILILFTLYKYYYNSYYNVKRIKKFDYKMKGSFEIKNIEFFKDNKKIEYKKYNNEEINNNFLNLKIDFIYDFFIANYTYNNKNYKLYSENSYFKFPIYSDDQINNYVYINKITSASLIINNENEDYKKIIDILDDIIPFLGPNYNFYNDLLNENIRLNIKNILLYLKLNNKNKYDFINDNYMIKFFDNFNNEYNIDLNYLRWNPELKL